jgi:ribonuclease Z
VCREVENLAQGADVLVHEAFRKAGTAEMLSDPDRLAAYHADTVELGAMAERAGVGTLMLTHLIPPLRTPEDQAAYEADIRDAGFTGTLIVAQDLETVTV